jgi:hypothetical protein
MIFTLFLGACNLPSNTPTEESASLTAAAQTIQALLPTNTPLGLATATPTFTPFPNLLTRTITPPNTAPPLPSATSNCNVMDFVDDVTIPDGTVMTPGQTFTKTWRLKNIGTCAWTTSYAVVFSTGDAMNGPSAQALTGIVNPGQTVDISVNLTAPAGTGDFTGNWKLRDASGVLFGFFFVKIKVQNPATATNTSPPPFAVTSVSFINSGGCGGSGFTATANVTVNGAGSVTYHWIYSDGATDTNVHAPIVYSAAGTQSVSETWTTTASGTHWIDIYIDTPNHQQFGRASFTCP